MKKKINGFMIVLFLASLVGIVVSYTLIEEDVLSTAGTLFEYLPQKYGVTLASTWEGSIRLGIFITISQVVFGFIASAPKGMVQKKWRWSAGVLFTASLVIDYWTDIVYRSNYFSGNIYVAFFSTMFFYTLGSELLQTAGWVVLITIWRSAIREIMWTAANIVEATKAVGSDWSRLRNSASSSVYQDSNAHISEMTGTAQRQSYPASRPSNQNYGSTLRNSSSPQPYSSPSPSPRPAPRQAPHPASQSASASTVSSLQKILEEKGLVNPKPTTQSKQTSFLPNEPTYHPVSHSSSDYDA